MEIIKKNKNNENEVLNEKDFIEFNKNNGEYKIFATVTSGLESIAGLEILEKFPKSKVYYNIKKLPGRILFNLIDIEESTIKRLYTLKSIEHMYALVGTIKDQINNKINNYELFKECITKLFTDEQWEMAFNLWKSYKIYIKGIKNKELLNHPLFKVTGKIAGEHNISSIMMDSNIAEGILLKFPKWRTSLNAYELEVISYLRFNEFYLGLSITESSLSLKQVNPNRNLGITPLRPAIAYALAKIANLKHGDIVIDPMCGCGTIPEFNSFEYPNCYFIGGDISNIAIQKSLENVQKIKSINYDLIKWNSIKLPFANHSIDVIITDMPFGKRIGSHSLNEKLYPKLLKEFIRIISINQGRIILLTKERKYIYDFLKNNEYFLQENYKLKINKVYTINQGGLDVFIFSLSLFEENEQEIPHKNKKQKF